MYRTRVSQIREHLGETQTVFAQRFKLPRHDIANHERGLWDIPAKVLAEQDQQGFCVGWVLIIEDECLSKTRMD